MIRTVAIVPAAGSGERLGSRTRKPFVLLKGVPIVVRTLKALSSSDAVNGIIAATDRDSVNRLKGLVKKYRIKKVIDVVIGGKTRLESVRNCLKRVDAGHDIVLIHDCARPLIEGDIIKKAVRLAAKYGACVTAVPETDTVKLAGRDMFVKKTLDRNLIYRAQTPQAFRSDLIKRSYSLKDSGAATDDSALAESRGAKVKILVGSYRNIKITTKEDLKLAEVLL
jgi:2-C-methyl-D-erythritol 4-phosphate cytidylyltransferase